MYEKLIEQMRAHGSTGGSDEMLSPPSPESLALTESQLGFALPSLLKECYLSLGNGRFGPGYGVMGAEGGYASDYGNIAQTYKQLSGDFALEDKEWPTLMLPFCEWGCNIFSCVDCGDDSYMVFTFEDFDLWPQEYDLEQFFRLWVQGVEILDYDKSEIEEIEIQNPFTGKKDTISRRKRP